MKDEKEKSQLEERGLLSGFIDGELDSVEVQRVCSSLDANERKSALEDQRLLRTYLKSFIRFERSDLPQHWSVWERIEADLKPYRSRLRFLSMRSQRPSSSAGVSSSAREFLEVLLQPQVAGSIFAFSFALMAASIWNNQSLESVDSGIQFAEQSPLNGAASEMDTASLQEFASVDAARSGFTAAESPLQTRHVGAEAQVGADGIISFVGDGAPVHRLARVQSLYPRGLRVGGADIEWIRAEAHVEIVPAMNEKRAPVIWVGDNFR